MLQDTFLFNVVFVFRALCFVCIIYWLHFGFVVLFQIFLFFVFE